MFLEQNGPSLLCSKVHLSLCIDCQGRNTDPKHRVFSSSFLYQFNNRGWKSMTKVGQYRVRPGLSLLGEREEAAVSDPWNKRKMDKDRRINPFFFFKKLKRPPWLA